MIVLERYMSSKVLVLNSNYQPLNVCAPRRALVLIMSGRAEVIEVNGAIMHSESLDWHVPSVIRTNTLVHRPRPHIRLSRREIFIRDGHTCQYCGKKSQQLTLDHVIPKHRGGKHSWDNLVSACRTCNHKKAGRTPEEARMPLKRVPYEPYASFENALKDYLVTYDAWVPYVVGQ